MAALLNAHALAASHPEVLERYHVTARWLVREAKAGRMPCLRLSARTVLFDPDQVVEVLESRWANVAEKVS